MYTKPVIYKIYSIIVFALACIGFLPSLVIVFTGLGDFGNILSIFNTLDIMYGSGDFGNILQIYNILDILSRITILLASAISIFFAFVEFTSMFTFAQMIEHEQSGATTPFRKMPIVFPAGFYKGFGSVMFYIPLVVDFFAIIVTIISYSVSKNAFLAIPVIPIAGMLLGLLLTYITYFCRFRTFGDLLRLKSAEKKGIIDVESLKENKPNMLRGFCTFLFVLAILELIGCIISVFFVVKLIASVLGGIVAGFAAFGTILIGVVDFAMLAIIGCYYDNLAKMMEHYLIKYSLI